MGTNSTKGDCAVYESWAILCMKRCVKSQDQERVIIHGREVGMGKGRRNGGKGQGQGQGSANISAYVGGDDCALPVNDGIHLLDHIEEGLVGHVLDALSTPGHIAQLRTGQRLRHATTHHNTIQHGGQHMANPTPTRTQTLTWTLDSLLIQNETPEVKRNACAYRIALQYIIISFIYVIRNYERLPQESPNQMEHTNAGISLNAGI